MSILSFAHGSFKTEFFKHQKMGCDQYALISHFWYEKCVTEIFEVRMRRSGVVV